MSDLEPSGSATGCTGTGGGDLIAPQQEIGDARLERQEGTPRRFSRVGREHRPDVQPPDGGDDDVRGSAQFPELLHGPACGGRLRLGVASPIHSYRPELAA